MAFMLENVLGYLRPKSQPSAAADSEENRHMATGSSASGHPCGGLEGEDDTDWVYDIEDQDDWQIVRKMDEDDDDNDEPNECAEETEKYLDDHTLELDDEVSGMEDVENWYGCRSKSWQKSWYMAPPPCFTRSAPSPSTNPLENLLIEHPSMSVYLLPVAASSSNRHQNFLCRSAPPVIMEQTLGGNYNSSTDQSATFNETMFPVDHTSPVVVSPLVNPPRTITTYKRKRRVRTRKSEAVVTAAPNPTAAAANATRTELGALCTADELDKQVQNEEKDQRTNKKVLAKNQLQRTNLLTEVNVPKKCPNRNGKYRCLH